MLDSNLLVTHALVRAVEQLVAQLSYMRDEENDLVIA